MPHVVGDEGDLLPSVWLFVLSVINWLDRKTPVRCHILSTGGEGGAKPKRKAESSIPAWKLALGERVESVGEAAALDSHMVGSTAFDGGRQEGSEQSGEASGVREEEQEEDRSLRREKDEQGWGIAKETADKPANTGDGAEGEYQKDEGGEAVTSDRGEKGAKVIEGEVAQDGRETERSEADLGGRDKDASRVEVGPGRGEAEDFGKDGEEEGGVTGAVTAGGDVEGKQQMAVWDELTKLPEFEFIQALDEVYVQWNTRLET